VKVRCSRSLVCARIAGTLGSPLPPRPRIFTRAHAVFRSPSAPPFDEVSSSLELSASSRVLRPARCPSCPVEPRDPTDGRRAPPLGSSSLIAASAVGVHHSTGNPDPAVTFRPRRFSRPRRLSPPPAFAGLFHPAATSRVCPSGVCPSPRSRAGFPRPRHALLTLGAPACDQRNAPSPSGPCSPLRARCRPGRIRSRSIRAPHGLAAPPGLLPAQPGNAFTSPSAHDLHREEPLAAGPRRLAVARIGLPGIRLPTRSSFPA